MVKDRVSYRDNSDLVEESSVPFVFPESTMKVNRADVSAVDKNNDESLGAKDHEVSKDTQRDILDMLDNVGGSGEIVRKEEGDVVDKGLDAIANSDVNVNSHVDLHGGVPFFGESKSRFHTKKRHNVDNHGWSDISAGNKSSIWWVAGCSVVGVGCVGLLFVLKDFVRSGKKLTSEDVAEQKITGGVLDRAMIRAVTDSAYDLDHSLSSAQKMQVSSQLSCARLVSELSRCSDVRETSMSSLDSDEGAILLQFKQACAAYKLSDCVYNIGAGQRAKSAATLSALNEQVAADEHKLKKMNSRLEQLPDQIQALELGIQQLEKSQAPHLLLRRDKLYTLSALKSQRDSKSSSKYARVTELEEEIKKLDADSADIKYRLDRARDDLAKLKAEQESLGISKKKLLQQQQSNIKMKTAAEKSLEAVSKRYQGCDVTRNDRGLELFNLFNGCLCRRLCLDVDEYDFDALGSLNDQSSYHIIMIHKETDALNSKRPFTIEKLLRVKKPSLCDALRMLVFTSEQMVELKEQVVHKIVKTHGQKYVDKLNSALAEGEAKHSLDSLRAKLLAIARETPCVDFRVDNNYKKLLASVSGYSEITNLREVVPATLFRIPEEYARFASVVVGEAYRGALQEIQPGCSPDDFDVTGLAEVSRDNLQNNLAFHIKSMIDIHKLAKRGIKDGAHTTDVVSSSEDSSSSVSKQPSKLSRIASWIPFWKK